MANKNKLLPIQEPTLYIMLSLRGGEKHGYGIIKDIAEISNGRVNLSTGTLYGAIYRLLDQGWIEQVEVADNSRRKKAYRLTLSGLEAFDTEVNRMKHVLHAVDKNSPAMEGRR